MSDRRKFIIYAQPYDENIGGIIALHKLCDLINRNGEEAYIYPNIYRYSIQKDGLIHFFCHILKDYLCYPKRKIKQITMFFTYCREHWCCPDRFSHWKSAFVNLLFTETARKASFTTNGQFNTPSTYFYDPDNSIVIYAETISGNPLNAKNVVRWFLHKPGFHTGVIDYGPNELYFFYQVIFNDPMINPNTNNLLTVMHVYYDIYKQTNFGTRVGTCYILRKGKDRPAVHDLSDSILIDGKSHKEIAEIFNQVEFCISYDTETMYSSYAVLCGCKSIVVPKEGISKDEWQPKKEYQYGIAYGFNDFDEADTTKTLLLPYLKNQEEMATCSVIEFIEKCDIFFPMISKFGCISLSAQND